MGADETLLDRLIGPDAFVVTLAGAALPLTDVGPIVIRYGRESPSYRVEAATLSFSYRAAIGADPPEYGATVRVDLGADAIAHFSMSGGDVSVAGRRFTGTVSDVNVTPPAGDGYQAISVVAVSTMARLARAPKIPNFFTPMIGDKDRGMVDAILVKADVAMGGGGHFSPHAFDWSVSGAGDVTVDDSAITDPQPPLAWIYEVADSAGGVLWEDRKGFIKYYSRDAHRGAHAAGPRVTLSADEILWPMTWVKNLEGVANSATVAYSLGTESLVDDDGVLLIGELIDAQLSTLITTEVNARIHLFRYLANRSRPRWKIPDMVVDLIRRFPAGSPVISSAQATALLKLEFGSLVGFTGLPAGPFTSGEVWVEGWTETITSSAWRLSLDVSEYGTAAAPLRWNEVDGALTWADVPPDLGWFQAATWDGEA